jgi:type 1 glutamine amidotransferase
MRHVACRSLLPAALVTLGACGGGSPAGPSTAGPPAPTTSARVLVVTHTTGFRHSSIPTAEAVLESIGRSSRLFEAEFARTSEDVRALMTAAALTRYDAVVFANTTGNLGIPSMPDFLAWIAAGRGFAGMHSASDTYHDEPQYLEMLGNRFVTHGVEAAVDALVETPAHPASAPLGSRFRSFDEIYRFARQTRGQVTMLLSLDRHPADGLTTPGGPADLPLSWAKGYGAGLVFYTALGHRDDVWTDPLYQQHILGGIRWVLAR